MTMGWHTMMGFSPSLVGCYIWSENYSFELIRKSRACVINIPTADLVKTVIGIGNTTGRTLDKFAAFGLTPRPAERVAAPLIRECFANFECRLVEPRLISTHDFFIFQVVKAHVAVAPRYPRTLHYRGDGIFMLSGPSRSYRKLFKPEML